MGLWDLCGDHLWGGGGVCVGGGPLGGLGAHFGGGDVHLGGGGVTYGAVGFVWRSLMGRLWGRCARALVQILGQIPVQIHPISLH